MKFRFVVIYVVFRCKIGKIFIMLYYLDEYRIKKNLNMFKNDID